MFFFIQSALRHQGNRTFLVFPRTEQPHDDHKKERNKKDCQNGRRQHAAEDTRADGMPAVGTRACADRQRQHAEDKGQRGHENRAKPHPAGLYGCLAKIRTLVIERFGELNDQDGVFSRQTNGYYTR